MSLFRTVSLSLLLAGLLAMPAIAQEVLRNETLNAQVTQPEGWNVAEGSDRTTFNFRHPETQSQIEVIGTPLITADVADIFFSTFHDTVRGAEFLNPREEEKTYGSWTGTETVYQFSHSSVELRVTVFQFVDGDTAWLVVGYMPTDAAEGQGPIFGQVVSSLSSAGDQ